MSAIGANFVQDDCKGIWFPSNRTSRAPNIQAGIVCQQSWQNNGSKLFELQRITKEFTHFNGQKLA
jgi:hypothetical protein